MLSRTRNILQSAISRDDVSIQGSGLFMA